MTIPQTKIMLCNCGKSMPLDGTTINEACGRADAGSDVATSLCRAQQDRLAAAMEAIGADEQLLVACTQEEKTFEDIASELGKPRRRPSIFARWQAGQMKLIRPHQK